MTDWRAEFYEAKYHLDISKRMLRVYGEYAEKRILVGVIREAAKASAKLIRAFLIKEQTQGDLKTFINKVAPKYLDPITIKNLVKILEIEKDQKNTRVEFTHKDKILLEIKGEWRVLKVSRLKELIDTVDNIISNFPTGIKRPMP